MSINNKGSHTVMVVPDIQAPFQHAETMAFLRWVKAKYKPDTFVNLGDEMDYHALGDWDHDPDGFSPGHEHEAGLAFMRQLYKEFPKMMVCTSNHTARPLRRAFKAGIPKAFLRDYKDFMQAPKGWNWKDQWEIDGVVYEHGEGFSGRDGAVKCALKNGKPTVIGHIHSFAGIQYWANSTQLLFGFNVGCLIDKDKYAFRYGKHNLNKPILGVGIVKKGVPTFIPMLLDSRGRWIKG